MSQSGPKDETEMHPSREPSPTRIVLVAHQYWPVPGPATLRFGTFVEELERAFNSHQITVLTTRSALSDRLPKDAPGEHGESVVPLRTRDAKGQNLKKILRIVSFGIEAFVRLLRLGRFDLVIADPPPFAGLAAIWAAKRRGAVSVYYFCDSWALVAKSGGLAGRLAKVIAFVENRCLVGADVVMASEVTLQRDALRRGAKNVILAENGANIELISQIEREQPLERETSVPYFVYAGTHSTVHGARIFVDAAELLWASGVEFELRFYGEGTDAPWLRQKSAGSGGRMTHSEPVPMSELIPILDGAVASLASLGDVPDDYYATPSKIYTSLAVGCPVLYAGVSEPVAFLRTADVGWILPRAAADVAEQMRACLGNLEQAASGERDMSERCRTYARDHRDLGKNLKAAAVQLAETLSVQRLA